MVNPKASAVTAAALALAAAVNANPRHTQLRVQTALTCNFHCISLMSSLGQLCSVPSLISNEPFRHATRQPAARHANAMCAHRDPWSLERIGDLSSPRIRRIGDDREHTRLR